MNNPMLEHVYELTKHANAEIDAMYIREERVTVALREAAAAWRRESPRDDYYLHLAQAAIKAATEADRESAHRAGS